MTSARHAAVICQATSLLLSYPDEGFHTRLPLLTDAVASLPAGQAQAGLERFLAHVANTGARDLAEHYVATFDRRRRCCLY